MPTRREVAGSLMGIGSVLIAGCSGGSSGTSGGDGGGGDGISNEENCRTVTRTQSETVLDEWETYAAGSTRSGRMKMEEGQRLIVSARLTNDGARPAIEVEGPSGSLVADVGPAEMIEREITARESGDYYITFENEAMLTSGEWDISITAEADYKEEVCE